MLEALSSVPSSGYHSIATGNYSGDEAFSNSGRAACHEPSKLRHYSGEVKDRTRCESARMGIQGVRRSRDIPSDVVKMLQNKVGKWGCPEFVLLRFNTTVG